LFLLFLFLHLLLLALFLVLLTTLVSHACSFSLPHVHEESSAVDYLVTF
jgi:hypothetical protein